MCKWSCFGLSAWINFVPDWPTIHKYNRVVSVLPYYRCAKARYIFSLALTGNNLKTSCRDMVTFVYNKVTVFTNNIINNSFFAQALYQRNIDYLCGVSFSASNLTDLFWIDV